MRVRFAIALALVAGSLAWVASQGLSGSVVYFVTPTEILYQSGDDVGKRVRLGGLVLPGSSERDGTSVRFVVSDGNTRVTVIHTGETPDLFRSGIGVVLEGSYRRDGMFHSDSMMIKHSEEYRPPRSGETPKPVRIRR